MSDSRRHADRRRPHPSGTNRRPAKRRGGRFVFVIGTLVLLLVAVAARLVYLQAIAGPAFAAKARAQRTRDVELPPRRGTIYDREGEPLAVSIEAKSVYAMRQEIKDKKAAAQAVAQTLGLDATDIEAKLARDAGFVYLARRVDVSRATALKALEIKGIGFLNDSRRSYPAGDIACQILGFTNAEGKGRDGIERYYESTLAGKPGVLLSEKDPYGRPIPGGIQKSIDPVNGDDVVLTIDKDLQYKAQHELEIAVKQYHAKGGYVIVMNPRSGEIYAMASTPFFDANEYGKASPEARKNRCVYDVYEPGSTIKSITAASVVDKGLFTADSKFVLPPKLVVDGKEIHESHERGTETWTLAKIITESSNVGAVKLGQALGVRGLRDYFVKFGLDERTGVDFPGEGKGFLLPAKDWKPISLANIPFGQGVSMTPLQIVRAMAAIACGGQMPTPHFLLSLPQRPDSSLEWPHERAISADAAAATSKMLQEVVTSGTGTDAAVKGYSVAGKTGTAQRPNDGRPGYTKGAYVSSFIGYLPAEDPQVLIAVILDRPTGGIYYGGTVAAPAFSRIGQFCMAHFKIPPSPKPTPSDDATATGAPAGESN